MVLMALFTFVKTYSTFYSLSKFFFSFAQEAFWEVLSYLRTNLLIVHLHVQGQKIGKMSIFLGIAKPHSKFRHSL